MKRAPIVLVLLLVLGAPAPAESLPSFSLYGHVEGSDRIVLAVVGEEGRAKVVSVLRGKPVPGGEIALDPEHLLLDLAPDDRRAILFLAGGRLVGDETGVAWVRDGRVEILQDGWEQGIVGPEEYRAPTVAEFGRSVAAAAGEVGEVARAAALPPGAERAATVTRILARPRPMQAWYVVFGPGGRLRTFVEEVRAALAAVIDDLSDEERALLLAAALAAGYGSSRREHLELLLALGFPPELTARTREILRACYETARALREKVTCARTLLATGDPLRFSALLADIRLEKPELSAELIALLRAEGRGEKILFRVRPIARKLLSAGKDPDGGRLGHAIADLLLSVRDDGDLPLLLDLARSPLACRNQALANLRTWTGEEWEADDPRWEKLFRE